MKAPVGQYAPLKSEINGKVKGTIPPEQVVLPKRKNQQLEQQEADHTAMTALAGLAATGNIQARGTSHIPTSILRQNVHQPQQQLQPTTHLRLQPSPQELVLTQVLKELEDLKAQQMATPANVPDLIMKLKKLGIDTSSSKSRRKKRKREGAGGNIRARSQAHHQAQRVQQIPEKDHLITQSRVYRHQKCIHPGKRRGIQ